VGERNFFRRIDMARGDQFGRQWKIIQIFVSIRISQAFSTTEKLTYLPFLSAFPSQHI